MPFYLIHYEQVYSSRGGVAHGTGDVKSPVYFSVRKNRLLKGAFFIDAKRISKLEGLNMERTRTITKSIVSARENRQG